MTQISVGDRVRATNENGDTAEVTVTAVSSSGSWVETEHVFLYKEEGWSFEVLEKPLPPEYGLYQPRLPGSDTRIEHGITYRYADTTGWVDALNNEPAEDRVKRDHQMYGLVRLVWED